VLETNPMKGLSYTVGEIVEGTPFTMENLEYFFTKGLRVIEIRRRGHQKPLRKISSRDLIQFLFSHYHLDALEVVGIPVVRLIEQKEPPYEEPPAFWDISFLASFLKVEESLVRQWHSASWISAQETDGRLLFPVEAVESFLGVSRRELGMSLPYALTQKELESLNIHPNHVIYPHVQVEHSESTSAFPRLQFITRPRGEIYLQENSIVRYSKLYVLDYVMNINGAGRWMPFLVSHPELVEEIREWRSTFQTVEEEKKEEKIWVEGGPKMKRPEKSGRIVTPEKLTEWFQSLEDAIRAEIHKAAENVQTEVGKKLFDVLETMQKLKDQFLGLPGIPVPTKEVQKPKRPAPGTLPLKGTGWFRRGPFIVRTLSDMKGKTYEQRCTVDEFRQVVDEMLKFTEEHARAFSTADLVRTLGWKRSYRFRIHLVAYILIQKGLLRSFGKGKSVQYEVTGTPEAVKSAVEEILSSP